MSDEKPKTAEELLKIAIERGILKNTTDTGKI